MVGGSPMARPIFALRPRQACDRVHGKHHVLALVAEILGDGGGDERALEAEDGRLVGSGDDDDRPSQTLLAQVAFDELADFAAALADEGDDVDVGGGVAGDHGEQRALPHARAGEDADALALAAGEQAVDAAGAEGEGLRNPLATERMRRVLQHGIFVFRLDLAEVVKGPAEAVEHAAL